MFYCYESLFFKLCPDENIFFICTQHMLKRPNVNVTKFYVICDTNFIFFSNIKNIGYTSIYPTSLETKIYISHNKYSAALHRFPKRKKKKVMMIQLKKKKKKIACTYFIFCWWSGARLGVLFMGMKTYQELRIYENNSLIKTYNYIYCQTMNNKFS